MGPSRRGDLRLSHGRPAIPFFSEFAKRDLSWETGGGGNPRRKSKFRNKRAKSTKGASKDK